MSYRRGILALLLVAASVRTSAAQQAATSPTGRLTGVVVDRETARPIAGAQIAVAVTGASTIGTTTDLDGRYRTASIPVGRHTVRVLRLGYRPVQMDSAEVRAGEATVLNVAMEAAAATLGGMVVTADRARRASSEAGLLEVRQKASAVTDGISAEQISRTPDSNAGDAMVRVAGVAVLDNKFVVVRGLTERYSNTLLNGVELPSPEPTRKIVPLDIFPSSLLEAVVTTKSGMPDRPSDFAGGSVDVQTKEFPENRIFQLSFSQGYNDRATLRQLPFAPQRRWDFAGFDDGHRAEPRMGLAVGADAVARERFAEALPALWTPGARRVLPATGGSISAGGPGTLFGRSLGYVLSLTYGNGLQHYDDRLYRTINSEGNPVRGFTYLESTNSVDVGAIANVSVLPTSSTKLGFKNIYTRNAEESVITANGFDLESSLPDSRGYQVSYVTREFMQNQLALEQRIGLLHDSRIGIKLSRAQAGRDEPANRSVRYARNPDSGILTIATNINPFVWFRYLDDGLMTGQADWSLPLSLHRADDALVKAGFLRREKRRTFAASLYRYTFDPTAPGANEIFALEPQRAFAPENLGTAINVERLDAFVVPYESDDDVSAWYAMLDAPVLSWLRVTGGVRQEDWSLRLYSGKRAKPIGVPVTRDNADLLWSANVRASLSDRMNLRLSSFTSVTRPDGRELSEDFYVPVVGQCAQQGSPSVQRTRILNGDVRWEWFPAPDELMSIGGFFKRFDQPIVELLDVVGGGTCRTTFRNGTAATNYGAEVELRRHLAFLPGVLRWLAVGVNATWVASVVEIDTTLANLPRNTPLQGQSPLLINASLTLAVPSPRVTASLLYNWFADRITQYGISNAGGGQAAPNVVEQGRHALDAKLQRALGQRLTMTLSARNLLDEHVLYYQKFEDQKLTHMFWRPGRTVTAGVGLDF